MWVIEVMVQCKRLHDFLAKVKTFFVKIALAVREGASPNGVQVEWVTFRSKGAAHSCRMSPESRIYPEVSKHASACGCGAGDAEFGP
jgi:hypothetical protein